MAANYWDYIHDSTTGDDWISYDTASDATGATPHDAGIRWWYESTTTGTQYFRRYIVTGFKNWLKRHRADLTKLINDETDTGWTIEMWMDGDIDVCDPSIEIIKARAWWHKVRARANSRDLAKLDDFYESLPKKVRKALG